MSDADVSEEPSPLDDAKLVERARAHNEAVEETARTFLSIRGHKPDETIMGLPRWKQKALDIEAFLDAYIPALERRGFKIFPADCLSSVLRENERLREALKDIRAMDARTEGFPGGIEITDGPIGEFARAALDPKG